MLNLPGSVIQKYKLLIVLMNLETPKLRLGQVFRLTDCHCLNEVTSRYWWHVIATK